MKLSMKFNYCISNPAFNISEKNNIAGTGGNTTLYKTITRNDFNNRLKPNGVLLNITPKGIIPDLSSGFFSQYEVPFINLMDDINVWKYNTCYFAVKNSSRVSPPAIRGGLSQKLYAINDADRFDFTYYSGSNNGMSKFFIPNGPNRVIRQLPGRGREVVLYDHTDKDICSGPKFAFSVLESRKSYTVTDEPIYGGTICYVSCNTIKEANALKLFVERNEVFAKYVKHLKLRGHAFGLRHLKRFDLAQIKTGFEIPVEWNITDADLTDPSEILNHVDVNSSRKKQFGEVFTPTKLVDLVLDDLQSISNNAFINNTATFIDSMCGDGQFLFEILTRKINNGINFKTALSTIYGVELLQDNVDLCRERLLCGREELRSIVEKNIVCADALKYHYRFDGSPPYDKTGGEKQEEHLKTLFE